MDGTQLTNLQTCTYRHRRPLPADLTRPFLTNFGTGVGLHVWEGGVRVRHAFTAAGMGARADGAKDDTGPGVSSDAGPWCVYCCV